MLTTSALAGHLTHGLFAASRSSPARKSISAEAPAVPIAFKSKAAPTARLATAQPAKPLVHTIAKNTIVPSGPKTLRNIAQPAVTDKVVTPNMLTTADRELPEPQDPWQARLDALLADWHTADSPYDFNGDGTVDPYDLAIYLSGNFPQQDAPPQQPTVTGAIPAPVDSKPAATDKVVTPNMLTTADRELPEPQDPWQARLDALLADWHTADSPYDFNGDGTVDPYDLAIYLSGNFPQQDAPLEKPAVTARPAERVATRLTSAIFAARDRDRDGTIREKDFAGGQHLFRRIDRDGDGVISRTDLHDTITDSLRATMKRDEPLRLGHFTRSWASAFNRHGKADGPAKMSEHIPSMRRHVHVRAAAEHIAHALQPQFSSNPTDIRQVVDKSSLADDQKKMILDRIAAWHPRGLKVSLVG